MSDRHWWAMRSCARKKRYATYAQAKVVLEEMRGSGRAGPTLHVYRCDVRPDVAEHFHLGRATGNEAKRLIKRAEKQRRKALVAASLPVASERAGRSGTATNSQ